MLDNTKETKSIEELEKKLEEKNRKIRILIIINIILIILLLLLYILGYRVGFIGYKEVVADPTYVIEVKQDELDWTKIEQLDIFNNSKFNNEKIIAPNSKEIYQFAIKNVANEDIEYKIEFEEKAKYKINMEYRLKIDNIYIAGNENQWVSVEELKQEFIKVTKGSINVFTLEWKWIDDDTNDTYVGTQLSADYTLKIKIDAKLPSETGE